MLLRKLNGKKQKKTISKIANKSSFEEGSLAEEEFLGYHDALMAKKFTYGELYRSAKTIEALDILGAKIRYAERRKRGESLIDISPYAVGVEQRVSINVIVDRVHDEEWERFALFCISFMNVCNFNKQPSVNLFDVKDKRKETFNNQETSYEMFAKVSLLEHTNNVAREFKYFIDSVNFIISDQSKTVLGLACLMHDFGKSIELVEMLGLNSSGMNTGEYHHDKLGEEIVYILAERFEDATLLKKNGYKQLVQRISKAVGQHHIKSYQNKDVHDDVMKYLKQIDRSAREKEMKKLNKE